jgi:hypothetical protein
MCNSNSKGRNCEECNNGYFGANCSMNCEADCLKCSKIDGKCILRATTTAMSTRLPTELSTSSTEIVTINTKLCDRRDFIIQNKQNPVRYSIQVYQLNRQLEIFCYQTVCLRKSSNQSLENYFQPKFLQIEQKNETSDEVANFCGNENLISNLLDINIFTRSIEVDQFLENLIVSVDLEPLSDIKPVCVYYLILSKNRDILNEKLEIDFKSYSYSCDLVTQKFNVSIGLSRLNDKSVFDSKHDFEFRQSFLEYDAELNYFNTTRLEVVSIVAINSSSKLIHFMSSNRLNVTLTCPEGYWNISSNCRNKCGRCVGGCDTMNGECRENKCQYMFLKGPFCDQCITGYVNYPDCDRKCEKVIPENTSVCFEDDKRDNSNQVFYELSSENVSFLWMTTIVVIICVTFLVKIADRCREKGDDNDLSEALYFNLILPVKSFTKN